jgi:hypothetical protein
VLSTLRRLMDRSRHLQPVDQAVLASVRQRLDGDLRERWDRQIDAISLVQRMPDGCEIEFCQLDGSQQDKRFANEAAELLVADVSFAVERRKLRCDVWCVRGELFSIEYSDCALMRLVNRSMRKRPGSGSPVCRMHADLAATAPVDSCGSLVGART